MQIGKITKKERVLQDTTPLFIISLDRVPTLIVRTLEQVNETNFARAFSLRGWEMNQENEPIVNADKAFIQSFLGNNAPFSKYALLRRTADGQHSFNVQIEKLPYMGLEILDMPKPYLCKFCGRPAIPMATCPCVFEGKPIKAV